MSVAADFLEWLSKNGGKGLMRDKKTGRMLPRPSAAEGVAEGPNFGGQYSVKGGEGMVRPSGIAEGPEFGGPFTARGETLAGQGAPSKALVPVRPAVEPPPNFTMVNPPGTSVAPRASTDIARFLEEADAAAAKSGAAASRWILPVAAGAAGIGAAGVYNDLGQPVPSGGPHHMLSAADAYRLGMASPPAPEPVPSGGPHHMLSAADAYRLGMASPQRDVPLPPRRPTELQPGLMDRIFNGGNYQSNGRLVSTPTDGAPINWGDNDRASDFFRADRELQARRGAGEDMGFARGGMPTAHEQALHKAMHIIHHLVTRR